MCTTLRRQLCEDLSLSREHNLPLSGRHRAKGLSSREALNDLRGELQFAASAALTISGKQTLTLSWLVLLNRLRQRDVGEEFPRTRRMAQMGSNWTV